jgi:hypothetical protein
MTIGRVVAAAALTASLGCALVASLPAVAAPAASDPATVVTAAQTARAVPATPADGLCTVIGDEVRYRSGPGIGYTALGLTDAGTQVALDGGQQADNPPNGTWWDKVSFFNGPWDVWIRADFLNCD